MAQNSKAQHHFLQLKPTQNEKHNLATHLVEYASFSSFLPESEAGQGDNGGNGGGVDVRDKRVVVQHGGSRRGSESEERGGGGEEGSGFELEKKRGRRRKESESRGGCVERR